MCPVLLPCLSIQGHPDYSGLHADRSDGVNLNWIAHMEMGLGPGKKRHRRHDRGASSLLDLVEHNKQSQLLPLNAHGQDAYLMVMQEVDGITTGIYTAQGGVRRSLLPYCEHSSTQTD